MTTSISRRRFLEGLASLAAWTAASSLVPLSACESQPSALTELDRLLPGRVLLPQATGYADFTSPWNLRWGGKRPIASAVVRAASAADVATAIRWATSTGTPIVARSGGHSYCGYSTTPGVVIDVSSMTSVAFDQASGNVALGGGARNQNVYDELAKVGRTLTHGRCYNVGVAGLVTGGGIGFNMRRLGLTCDMLLETQMVLGNGEIVTANARTNPDLFWAARGAGGGNFGIHTGFVFATAPANSVVVFDRTYTTKVEELLLKIYDLAYDAPRELGLKITARAKRDPVSGQNQIVMNLLGQWAGPMEAFNAFMAPINAIAQPDQNLGFVDSTAYWDGQKPLSESGEREYMYERSRYAMQRFGADAVAQVMAMLRAWPSTSAAASWKGFLTGGAVSDVAPDATAFVHRKDWMLTTIDLNWTPADDPSRVLDALQWVDQFHDAMQPYTSRESYQNFIDESETDWMRAYHGTNLERLVGIKRTVDPTNVFSFAQSIPLTIPPGI